MAKRAWVPVAVGLLPAMALGCLLVSNWASGRVPVETLGMQGGALVVDMEPNAPMRVVGEIEPLEMGMMAGYERQVLRQRYCGSECGQNMIICMKAPNANPGARECSKMKDECINVKCKNPSWESQILPCWDAARANYNNCAARSGADAHCKVLFLNNAGQCR